MDAIKAILWHLAVFPLTVLMHVLDAIAAIAEDRDMRALAAIFLVTFIAIGAMFMGWIGASAGDAP